MEARATVSFFFWTINALRTLAVPRSWILDAIVRDDAAAQGSGSGVVKTYGRQLVEHRHRRNRPCTYPNYHRISMFALHCLYPIEMTMRFVVNEAG